MFDKPVILSPFLKNVNKLAKSILNKFFNSHFDNPPYYHLLLQYIIYLTSRFGSAGAYPDLDLEVSGSSPGHTKDFKMVLTAPQPVLVIMSLSMGNT